ncbi:import inner membrane translocase subunit Tim44 [Methylocella silvestris BL2]|uniref:Import inner membrane translocase subunit Tim44 n=1 Tax=Methylocella silvestris (strain DSM 15510 / CIP 108128 / LMG 27833 / NCIMB 13906 / BL2) TaxID=395965 RepID=B8ENI0_METSB|nr:Tim44/TimA family putative adaptor protein [Methylocella silvestris]ACK50111.1 import inner membrane translocase subunit Tim44 [Methylocella silvestris BL2]
MQNSFDVSTIIFALLAAFVVWKLRSILGARTGTEKPPRNPFIAGEPSAAKRPGEGEGKVIPLPGASAPIAQAAAADPSSRWKPHAEPGSKAWAGLDAIAAADRSFEIKSFLEGAKTAYEMIVIGFADGDRPMLQNLLDKSVYDSFVTALTEREKRGDKIETSFVAIDNGAIADAELNGRMAEIAVRFSAQIITATRNAAGTVIEGNPEQVVEINDTWRFARDVGARDPNWRLISTGDQR